MSRLHMGIDVGSATVKVVVLDETKILCLQNTDVIFRYKKHR